MWHILIGLRFANAFSQANEGRDLEQFRDWMLALVCGFVVLAIPTNQARGRLERK
jgi:hypothetical protein